MKGWSVCSANSTHISVSILLIQALASTTKISAGLPASHLAHLYSVLHEADKEVFLKMQISSCHCVRNFLWLSTHFKHNLPCFQVSLTSPHAIPSQAQCHSTLPDFCYFVIGGFFFCVCVIILWNPCGFSPTITAFPQWSTGLESASDPLAAKLSWESHSLVINLMLFQAPVHHQCSFSFQQIFSLRKLLVYLLVNLIFK